MKKILSLILILIFCFSIVACENNIEKVESDLQGDWERVEDEQSSVSVYLNFQNGNVTRTETNSQQVTTTLNGTYNIDQDGYINISYTDGTSQQFMAHVTTTSSGIVLRDTSTGVYYNKAS